MSRRAAKGLVMCVALTMGLLFPAFAYGYDQTIDSGSNIGVEILRGGSASFTFNGLTFPTGDGVLTVTGWGDIGDPGETVDVYAEGRFLGSLFGKGYTGPFSTATDTVKVPAGLLEASASTDITITLVLPSTSGAASVSYKSLTLRYRSADPERESYVMSLACIGVPDAVPRMGYGRAIVRSVS